MKRDVERLRSYYERQLRLLDKPERKAPARAVANKRQHVWKHNSFFGHVAMSQKHMQAIASARSTTPEAKQTAQLIQSLLSDLKVQLQERID